MATMTTRAAMLALATGVTLSAGAVAGAAATAAPTATPKATCVFVSSPLTTCAPSHFAPNPSGPAVGDHTSIFYSGYKPGSTIIVTIPSFPSGHRIFSATVGSDGTATVSILLPLNAKTQTVYKISVQGVDQTNAPVLYATSLGSHTQCKPNLDAALRKAGLAYSICPKSQTKADKKAIANFKKGIKSSTAHIVLSGASVGSAQVAAPAKAAPAAAIALRPAAAVSAPSAASHGLAFTGAEIGLMTLAGAGLLGSGAFLVVAGRRRKTVAA